MKDNLAEEFAEFVRQREQKNREKDDEIEYVEVFDEKGRGARVPCWRAKEFLESLGIDVSDLEDESDESEDEDEIPPVTRRSVGRQSQHRNRHRSEEDE